MSACLFARHKEQREAFVNNAVNGGPMHVRLNYYKGKLIGYCWAFFYTTIHIPVAIGREWGLENSPSVNVRYEFNEGRHPHLYAMSSEDDDDGRHLAIQLSKEVDSVEKPHWLQCQTDRARKVANSISDFLLGRVVDPDSHEWGESRFPLVGRAGNMAKLERNASRKQAEPSEPAKESEPAQLPPQELPQEPAKDSYIKKESQGQSRSKK